MNKRIRLSAITILCALLLLVSSANADVTTFSVKPSDTDPQIKTFDFNHWVYINRDIVIDHKEGQPADRHQLLLWLPGTGGRGHDAQAFSMLAANLGYHVITLVYSDGVAANTCENDSDSRDFEVFRNAIIAGGRAPYHRGKDTLVIDRPESIENRLIKLLERLQEKRPKEEWSQFLTDDKQLKWESIAVAGESQGGGHAALIGIEHRIARAICFGAPKDYSQKLKSPATYFHDPSATRKDRFFAFNYHEDANTCSPPQMLANIKALGLDAFGAPVDVEDEKSPYHHSHILYTDYPKVTVSGPEDNEDIAIAHGAPIRSQYADHRQDVWTYLLTETITD